jgi:hypothetical protein
MALSASLGMAATPEKLGTTSKATKNASHPSRMLSFKIVRLVQAGSLDDTVTNVMISEKSSPEMAKIIIIDKCKRQMANAPLLAGMILYLQG